MKLDRGRPEILTPPGHPPACAPSRPSPPARRRAENPAETRLPLTAWRISYRAHRRRRLNAAIKDTAVNSIDRGWIREPPGFVGGYDALASGMIIG